MPTLREPRSAGPAPAILSAQTRHVEALGCVVNSTGRGLCVRLQWGRQGVLGKSGEPTGDGPCQALF